MLDQSTKNKIDTVLQTLSQEGLLENLNGNCVLASEIIQNLLAIEGVNSRTVEVTLAVSRPEENDVRSFTMVGYDFHPGFRPAQGAVDTHVVVITDTLEPMLIDASIGNLLRHAGQVVIAPVRSNHDEILCMAKAGSIDLIYRVKKHVKLPGIHQKDFIHKLRSELELKNKVDLLWKIMLAAILLSVANFALNGILVTLKLLFP